jgi:hypothetical protein
LTNRLLQFAVLSLLAIRATVRQKIASPGVVIFGMPQLILIVDLEFLGCFRVFIGLTLRCLILTRMFIVSIIVVIFSATQRVLGEDRILKPMGDG